jgi:gas vesicle structural protein
VSADRTLSTVGAGASDVTLLELLDRLLDKGVMLHGDITLAVADIDLVYIGLRAVVSSVSSLQRGD